MSKEATLPEKPRRFIAHMWKLDRKAFAHIRRSLKENSSFSVEAIPYVEPFTHSEQKQWHKDMYYLVAGLFCSTQRPLDGQKPPEPLKSDLGNAIAKLYLDKEKSPSIEKRFVTLLDADYEQLPYRLRQMITLLHSNKIPVAWEKLLADLLYWNNDSRSIQRTWAASFYGVVNPEPNETPSSEEPQTQGDDQ